MLDRFLFALPVQFSFSYRQTEHKSIQTPYTLVPILFELILQILLTILQNLAKSHKSQRFLSFRCLKDCLK